MKARVQNLLWAGIVSGTIIAAWPLDLHAQAVLSGKTEANRRNLNAAQIAAAPKDNPTVTTTGGYLEEVVVNDSDGKPVPSERKRAILQFFSDHGREGLKERTVWCDRANVPTWEAQAAINDDGSFPEDTGITGLNENRGRTELRKKNQPTASTNQAGMQTETSLPTAVSERRPEPEQSSKRSRTFDDALRLLGTFDSVNATLFSPDISAASVEAIQVAPQSASELLRNGVPLQDIVARVNRKYPQVTLIFMSHNKPAVSDLTALLGPANATEAGSDGIDTWHKYGGLDFGVSDDKVIAVRVAAKGGADAGNPTNRPASTSIADRLPPFAGELQGANPVRVRNPNDFAVATGIRLGTRGKNFNVAANGVQTVYVPNGKYDIYFVYSDNPDALFQGDSFTLNNNGVEIQIVKVVNGNYGIRQVK